MRQLRLLLHRISKVCALAPLAVLAPLIQIMFDSHFHESDVEAQASPSFEECAFCVAQVSGDDDLAPLLPPVEYVPILALGIDAYVHCFC
jgi:hypothetical protein